MLVYIDVASMVKSKDEGSHCCEQRSFFTSLELFAIYGRCLLIFLSSTSTHRPRPEVMLPTVDMMGRVFRGVLWTLAVRYRYDASLPGITEAVAFSMKSVLSVPMRLLNWAMNPSIKVRIYLQRVLASPSVSCLYVRLSLKWSLKARRTYLSRSMTQVPRFLSALHTRISGCSASHRRAAVWFGSRFL